MAHQHNHYTRLAQIYKKEKANGGNIATAVVKRAAEKYDPRQMINQWGILPQMFSFLKTYKAAPIYQGHHVANQLSTSDLTKPTQPTIQKIELPELKIISKQVLVLPAMSRDLNVVRQNIIKLVKLQGGAATNKADMFFRDAKQRENDYEKQFNKGKKETAPTKEKPKEEKSWLMMILGLLTSFLGWAGNKVKDLFTWFKNIFKDIEIGIEGFIKFVKESKFMDKLREIKDSIFLKVKNIFEEVKGKFSGWFEKIKTNIVNAFEDSSISKWFKEVGTKIDNIVVTIKESKFVKWFEELGTKIQSIFTSIRESNFVKWLQETGSKIGTKLTETFEWFKKLFSFSEEGGFLSQVLKYLKPLENLIKPILETGMKALRKIAWLAPIFAIFDFIEGFMQGNEEGGIGEGIFQGIMGVIKGFVTGFMDMIKDALSWVLEKLGFKGASEWLDSFSITNIFERAVNAIRDGLASFIEWVASIISKIPGTGDTVKSINDFAKGLRGSQKTTEDRKAEKAKPSVINQISDADNDREMRKLRDQGKPTPAASEPSTAPTPSSAEPENNKKQLLDKIAKSESGSAGYDAMNQGTSGNQIIGSGDSKQIINKKLTSMTVGEIMERAAQPSDSPQKRKDQGLIFAAGRYQIIPSTLKNLVDRGVAKKTDKFDEETQDRLATQLLVDRGYGKLQGAALQNSLAKEWASIPLATDVYDNKGILRKAGESYYGGANKAGKDWLKDSTESQGPSLLDKVKESAASGYESAKKSISETFDNKSPKEVAKNTYEGMWGIIQKGYDEIAKLYNENVIGEKLVATQKEIEDKKSENKSTPINVNVQTPEIKLPEQKAMGSVMANVVDEDFMKELFERSFNYAQ